MTPRPPGVLVVDDERLSVEAIRRTLEDDFSVHVACSAEEARLILEAQPPGAIDVVLCDQRMPGLTGIEFLKQVRETWPEIVRIIISGHTDAEDIIRGINDAGIYQYVLKPWMPSQLVNLVQGAVEAKQLHNDVRRMDLELRSSGPALRHRAATKQAALRLHHEFTRLVRAPGSPLEPVCALAQRVARYDLSVLVQGESGTGKELLARAIHHASPRLAEAFVSENCAAVPDTLLESELFGHKRGAFTGAYQDHIGLFQRASGGTLFLDEIGDTSAAFQVKLLRVLQEGEVRPIGSNQAIAVDVRVIAASHRDLETEVRAGRFREDLYYRLAGITLTLPALRERAGDLQVLTESLLDQAATELAKPTDGFTAQALACLVAYPWPGNIRELKNEVYRALVLSDGRSIGADCLSTRVLHGRALSPLPAHAPVAATVNDATTQTCPSTHGTLQERLDAIESALLKEALVRHRWNKTQAAQALGLSRVGLRQKLQRFGLEDKAS